MQINRAFLYSVFNKLRRDLLLFIFRLRERRADAQAIFDYYFRHNLFGDAESLSGTGSSLSATKTIRQGLAEILTELKPKSLLDIPCGDFNWTKEVDFRSCRYIGADIVKDLVEQNQKLYGNNDRKFLVLDILNDPLPKVDLVLCRDLFIHFPNEDVFTALTNIRRSGAKFLLTTSYSGEKRNRNIPLGSFRPLNLLLSPFRLPPPLKIIRDDDYLKFRGRTLCLWPVSHLPKDCS